MDDREAGTYSTPPEAAPSPEETRQAKASLRQGLPALIWSVFAAFVLVAIVGLIIRYAL